MLEINLRYNIFVNWKLLATSVTSCGHDKFCWYKLYSVKQKYKAVFKMQISIWLKSYSSLLEKDDLTESHNTSSGVLENVYLSVLKEYF